MIVAELTMQRARARARHLYGASWTAHSPKDEIKLDDGPDTIRTCTAGAACQSRYRGVNSGRDILLIMAVVAGADGAATRDLEQQIRAQVRSGSFRTAETWLKGNLPTMRSGQIAASHDNRWCDLNRLFRPCSG